jgi:hypothetical protein
MSRDRTIQILAALAALVALTGASVLTPTIAARAGRAQLSYTVEAEEGAPPEVAVGVALGAFKGLFVNVLWLRAQQLKEEGRFFDAIEVANTITTLTPRFPRVWAFHGWNLAYNISVATQTPEERWEWVQAGIRILRDEGIPKNPNATALYKELAWIYVHKIQGFTDDANHYYKQQLAREWSIIMGPAPPDPLAEDPDVQAYFARFRELRQDAPRDLAISMAMRAASVDRRIRMLESIAGAPSTRDELFETHPLAEELVAAIENEAGLQLDFDLLRYVEILRAKLFSEIELQGDLEIQLPDDQRNRVIEALLEDEDYSDAWRQVLLFTRKQLLTREFNMELPRMMRYTRQFGPIDWRHPAAHALYWAATGVEKGSTRQQTVSFDITNTDRLVLHSVQELFRWGDVQYDILTGSYFAMYNLEFVEAYGDAIELLEERATFFEEKGRHFRLYGSGYENHLRDVIRLYYRMGKTALAQHYFDKLRNWDGLNLNDDVGLEEDLSLPLAEFVKIDLITRLGSPQVVEQEMFGALFDAFIRGILRGQPEVYAAQLGYASQVHKIYLEKQNRDTPAGGGSRMGDYFEKRFVDIAGEALARVITTGRLGFIQAAELWRKAPTGLQQAAYDPLQSLGRNTIPNFDQLFPAPPNMERYRQIRAQMSAEDADLRLLQLRTEQQ